MSGLGTNYWLEVISVLRTIIPVYDRVNRAISLGQDVKFRQKGILGHVNNGDKVLDAGSGFGNMTNIALKLINGDVKIIMYDPIRDMLMNAKEIVGSKNYDDLSCGVFEYMPFKDNSMNVVMCGYSLRDAICLKDAITEVNRILEKGGRFIIVDLGKPDNFFLRYCVSFYLKYLLGILAYVVSGKSGLKFKTLYGTFLKWPRNTALYEMLKEKFPQVIMEKKFLGGAIIVVAYKGTAEKTNRT